MITNKCFILRGIPGSGKSTLSKELSSKYKARLCSADDFHIWWGFGIYDWQGFNTAIAHKSCQMKFDACLAAKSNVIVDNTNVRISDFKYYLEKAYYALYDIYVLEPSTEWKYDVEKCNLLNQHNVPKETIQRMLDSLNESKKIDKNLENKYGVKFKL